MSEDTEEPKKRRGRGATKKPSERAANVIGLFPERDGYHDQGVSTGTVPPGGASAENGDTRRRARFRLGKRWTEIVDMVKNGEMTWDEFVKDLTPTELARGQLMDKNGGFAGRPPSVVPRAFHDACIRELMMRGQVLYKENYIAAIQAMTSIAQDTRAKESDRIKAAQFVIERLEGKAVERVEIAAADPWQQIIGGIVAEVEDEQIARAQTYLERQGD